MCTTALPGGARCGIESVEGPSGAHYSAPAVETGIYPTPDRWSILRHRGHNAGVPSFGSLAVARPGTYAYFGNPRRVVLQCALLNRGVEPTEGQLDVAVNSRVPDGERLPGVDRKLDELQAHVV